MLILFLTAISCSNTTSKNNPDHLPDEGNRIISGYNLTSPDKTIILPAVLHEISGITILDTSSVACVQDEHGVVFIFDLSSNEISRQVPFHGPGDYEDVSKTNDAIYVLRSDGVLYEIKNLRSSETAKGIVLEKLTGNDNEGLCYDRKNNRLLIVHKDKPRKDTGFEDMGVVYGFDLKRRELLKNPVISFNLSQLGKFAADNKVFPDKEKDKKGDGDERDVRFRPSALAIHPVTGRLFVLSADEYLLYVFNINGTIEQMIRLSHKIFNMSEGISFFENGDMLISNEGKNKVPTLLRFNYRPD
jgi:uncharacterized protein YjiK